MAIKFFNSIDVGGEVKGTSLDVNGNADISGKLVLPQTSTTIGTANLANASLLVGSTSAGIGIDNNEIVANGNTLNISTISGNDIKFRTGATDVLLLDSSQNATFAGNVTITGGSDIFLADNGKTHYGASNDLEVFHDGSNSYVTAKGTGDLIIQNTTDDKDIIFQSDDGSGGIATYFKLDGGNTNIRVEKDIFLLDDVKLRIGSGTDLEIYHSSSSGDSFIRADAGTLYIQQTADDGDMIFQCDDGSGGTETYFFLDGSASSGNPRTIFPDNSRLSFGSSGDTYIEHDGSNGYIGNSTGHLYIRQNTDNGDIIFQSDDNSGGIATYLTLNGGEGQTVADVDINFRDDVKASFGNLASGDLRISHDATDSLINNFTGDLYIRNNADDKDVIFQSDDGSGGVKSYFYLDGSIGATIVPDSTSLGFGTGGDMYINHDGTNTKIDNYTGDFYIRQKSADKDLLLMCDDGSGGETAYLTLDGSAGHTTVQKEINFEDSVRATFGNLAGGDMAIYHDGTNNYHNHYTGDVYFRNNADDKDIIFQSDDGSGGTTAYLTLDGSATTTVFAKNIRVEDSVLHQFGGGNDMAIYHNGTDSFITNDTGDLKIRQFANDKDIIFDCDDGSGGTETYFFLDGSTGVTTFPDSKILGLGTGADLQIKHDGTNGQIREHTGNLTIVNSADDKDIIFQCDDGSGGVETYFFLDGSTGRTIFPDSKELRFGTGSDLNLYHDGSNSYVVNNTGNLLFYNNTDDGDIIFQSDDGSGGTTAYLTLDGGAGTIVASKPFQSSNVLQATPDKIGNITIQRESGSGVGNFNVDDLGSYILSKTDGGFGVGTKPSGSHNGTGFISLQTHTGNYFTQLALSTNTNDLFIRSANNASTFSSYERLVKEDDVILATDLIKVLPHHFMSNEDGGANKSAQFRDDTIIGVRTSSNDAELYAFVEIPYGRTATSVTVYGNDTNLVVNVYESDINAGALTDKTPEAGCRVGTACDITDVAYSTTNYLAIKVTTTNYTNDIVYGAVVVIT